MKMNFYDRLEKLLKLPKEEKFELFEKFYKEFLENRVEFISKSEILNALEIILIEEITHVKKGDILFKYACKQENINPLSLKMRI